MKKIIRTENIILILNPDTKSLLYLLFKIIQWILLNSSCIINNLLIFKAHLFNEVHMPFKYTRYKGIHLKCIGY